MLHVRSRRRWVRRLEMRYISSIVQVRKRRRKTRQVDQKPRPTQACRLTLTSRQRLMTSKTRCLKQYARLGTLAHLAVDTDRILSGHTDNLKILNGLNRLSQMRSGDTPTRGLSFCNGIPRTVKQRVVAGNDCAGCSRFL